MLFYIVVVISIVFSGVKTKEASSEGKKIIREALLKNKPNLCLSLSKKDSFLVNDCIFLVSYKYHDTNHCILINKDIDRAKCFGFVASGLCEKFNEDKSAKEKCTNALKHGISFPYTWHVKRYEQNSNYPVGP